MKIHKINEIEIKQVETIEDLPMKAWVAFKNYWMLDETGVEITTLKETFVKFTNEFDRNSPSGMFKTLYDYVYKLNQAEKQLDAWHLMFALLMYFPDEINAEGKVICNTDETYLKSKVDRLAELGFTQKQTVDINTAFILGLTTH